MKEFMLQWQEGQEYLISERKLRWVYEHGIMNGKHRKTVDRELTVRQFEIIRHNPDNGYYSFFYNGERQVNISIDTASDPNLVMIKCRDRFPGYAEGHTVYQSLPYDAKAKPIERFFVKLDNGKAFERKEFEHGNNDDHALARRMLRKEIRQIEKLKQRVAILEGMAAAESDQERSADQQTGDTPEGGKLPSNDTVASERSDRHFQQQHQGFQPASGHGHRSENRPSTEEPSLGFVERLIRESIQVIPLELVRINKPAVVLVRDPDTGAENRYMMTLSPIARS